MNIKTFFYSLTKSKKKEFINDLGVALNKSEVTIRSYINGNRNIQPEDARTISGLTNNSVPVESLCPKVFGESSNDSKKVKVA